MEEDCLGCRLTSGGGLLAASAYIYHQSSNKVKLNRVGMLIVSAGRILIFFF